MAAHDGIRSVERSCVGRSACGRPAMKVRVTRRNTTQRYTNSSSSSSSLSSSLRKWWLRGHQSRGRNADVRSADRHRSAKEASGDRRAHSRDGGGIGAEVWRLSSPSGVSWPPNCHPVPLVRASADLSQQGSYDGTIGQFEFTQTSPWRSRRRIASNVIRWRRHIQISMQIPMPKYIYKTSMHLATRIVSRLVFNRLYFNWYFILIFHYYYKDTWYWNDL